VRQRAARRLASQGAISYYGSISAVPTSNAPPTYSRSHRAVEIISILSVFGVLALFAIRIGRTVTTAGDWVSLTIAALTGYLLADFISGVVHWAGDTIGDETTPFLGKNFVTPFRYHHVDPKDIALHDFIETNGNNCIVVLAPLLGAFLLLPRHTGYLFFACTLMAFLSLFIVATNQFHKWAHSDTPPRAAVWLQRWGLILSPGHHDVHHARPHDRHYCITVGWMNPLLNRIRFFRGAEAVVAMYRPHWLHMEDRLIAHAAALGEGVGEGAEDDDGSIDPGPAGASPLPKAS
jgi:ubiquitin-conjugating enzyme E2 variant